MKKLLLVSALFLSGLNGAPPTYLIHENLKDEMSVDLQKEMMYQAAYSEMDYEKFEKLYDLYTEKFGPQLVPLFDMYDARVDIPGIKTGYSNYFSRSTWIDRDGEISLSVYWKDYLYEDIDTGNVLMYKAGKAWSALKKDMFQMKNGTIRMLWRLNFIVM